MILIKKKTYHQDTCALAGASQDLLVTNIPVASRACCNGTPL